MLNIFAKKGLNLMFFDISLTIITPEFFNEF